MRHLTVHDDDVDAALGLGVDSSATVVCRQHLKAQLFEDLFSRQSTQLFVIDDKNSTGHGRGDVTRTRELRLSAAAAAAAEGYASASDKRHRAGGGSGPAASPSAVCC